MNTAYVYIYIQFVPPTNNFFNPYRNILPQISPTYKLPQSWGIMLQKSHESPGRIRCRVSWTLRSSSKCPLPIRMNSASPRSGGFLVDPRWMWLLCWLCWFRRDKPHGFVWIVLGDAPIKFGLFMVVFMLFEGRQSFFGVPMTYPCLHQHHP